MHTLGILWDCAAVPVQISVTLVLALHWITSLLWVLVFTSLRLSWWAYTSPGAECHRGDTWEQVGTQRGSCSLWSPGRDIFTCTRQPCCTIWLWLAKTSNSTIIILNTCRSAENGCFGLLPVCSKCLDGLNHAVCTLTAKDDNLKGELLSPVPLSHPTGQVPSAVFSKEGVMAAAMLPWF